MSRSERWCSSNEIKKRFIDTRNPNLGAGPILYYENGKKYSDDSEAHIAVIGQTGRGKSQCCSLPFMRMIFEKGESLVMIDPKNEGFLRNAAFIPPEYVVYCLNFRNPGSSPTRWNPLYAPYRLYKSEDPYDNDIASSMIAEFWKCVYPISPHEDPFWAQAAANYAKGLSYGLIETAPPDHININSVSVMMEESSQPASGGLISRSSGSSLTNAFFANLPQDSLAKKCLASYVNAPHDTRASIHSVAANGLEVFSRSKGLMKMLGEDTLNILDLDVDRPFVLFVITPDETDVYDSLAGLLISQVAQHLIRVAQDRGGKLPLRVNFILEELGSVGSSIASLPNLMVASRSRNIRLMLVLQSHAQLYDVYGKSKAETIESCIGITIGFSTNSWETLTEWSRRCGERDVYKEGHIVQEPLITASQLAAMPSGTALVLADSKYKFITHLPFYDEMFDNSSWKAMEPIQTDHNESFIPPFSFAKLVDDISRPLRKDEQSLIQAIDNKTRADSTSYKAQEIKMPPKDTPSDSELEEIISKIDAQIAALEAEEQAKREKENAQKKYHVIIKSFTCDKRALAHMISTVNHEGVRHICKKLDDLPYSVGFKTKKEANKFMRAVVKEMGVEADLES